jgi:ribosomal protein S8
MRSIWGTPRKSEDRQPIKVYVITDPQFDISALVYAPNTKRAKTVFLDYLTRHGYIDWWTRSKHRPRLIVARATGNEDVEVTLRYDLEDLPKSSSPWAIRW